MQLSAMFGIVLLSFTIFGVPRDIAVADTNNALATEKSMKEQGQFVMATYQVDIARQAEFHSLLEEAERVMRSENLITNLSVMRMRSKVNPKLILELFEWVDNKAFERGQASPKMQSVWGKFESVWKKADLVLIAFLSLARVGRNTITSVSCVWSVDQFTKNKRFSGTERHWPHWEKSRCGQYSRFSMSNAALKRKHLLS